ISPSLCDPQYGRIFQLSRLSLPAWYIVGFTLTFLRSIANSTWNLEHAFLFFFTVDLWINQLFISYIVWSDPSDGTVGLFFAALTSTIVSAYSVTNARPESIFWLSNLALIMVIPSGIVVHKILIANMALQILFGGVGGLIFASQVDLENRRHFALLRALEATEGWAPHEPQTLEGWRYSCHSVAKSMGGGPDGINGGSFSTVKLTAADD
ncbi:hypothetical protein HDU76_009953, partial [Blyttiomyces sp. JEL0837]